MYILISGKFSLLCISSPSPYVLEGFYRPVASPGFLKPQIRCLQGLRCQKIKARDPNNLAEHHGPAMCPIIGVQVSKRPNEIVESTLGGESNQTKNQFQEGKEELELEVCVAGFPLQEREGTLLMCYLSQRQPLLAGPSAIWQHLEPLGCPL